MQTSPITSLPFFSRVASGAAALTVCSLTAFAQSAPPTFVQVPFESLFAGNASSNCAAALNANGDGCPATQIGLPSGDPFGTAADKWGNVYFGMEGTTAGPGAVRVVYAGAVSVNGVANPATAMIEAAYYPQLTSLVAGDVYTVAGGTLNSGPASCSNGATELGGNGSGCPGTDAYVKKGYGVAVDGDGNVFLCDESESVVYVVLANTSDLAAQLVMVENPSVTAPTVGTIYLIAGSGGGYADGVLAISGSVHNPYDIAVDANEDLFISDFTNGAVREINGPGATTTGANSADCSGGSCGPGFIHTIAGKCAGSSCTVESGTAGYVTPSNTPAIGAEFVDPAGIGVDAYGNVYVGDNADGAGNVPVTVRVIYAGGANNPAASLISIETGLPASSLTAGNVYTIAGHATSATSVGNGSLATASTVGFDRIYGLALDGRGNIYVTDYNGASDMAVAEVDASNGYLYFLSGGSVAGTLGSGDYCSGGTTGPTMTDAYGDGCPATQASLHHAEGNPSFDASGNMYVADNDDGLIRKLNFSSFPASAVGSPAATQVLAFSLLTGASSETASSVTASLVTQGTANGEFVNPGTGDTCTGSTTLAGFPNNTTTEGSSTCVVPVAFTPAKAGLRTGAVEIAATINSSPMTSTAFISGIGQGAAIAIDPGVMGSIGSSIGTAPQGVATDSAGNTYIAYANGTLVSIPAGPLATAIAGETANPHQIAVDGVGDVFVADTGNDRIAELVAGASAFTTDISSYGGVSLAGPEGVAVDGVGNLYIADTGNSRVLIVPQKGLPAELGSGFDTPVAIAVDASENVYVADSGLGAIAKIAAATGTQSTVLSGIAPVGLAVDAAGNLEYADSSLLEVVEIPVSGTTAPVVTGLTTPVGVALDANGGLYVADTANTSVSYYNRTASTQSFASTTSTVNATLTSIGNQSFVETGSAPTQTDATDFAIEASAGDGCDVTSQLTLAAGANCGITALFTPVSTGLLSDTVTLAGNAVNSSSVKLNISGTNTAIVVGTTTTLGSLAPSSPVYGQSVSVTVTVNPDSGTTTPTGNVAFTVDTVPQTPVPLSNGTYLLTLTMLNAGQHTISASYAGSGSFSGSISTTLTFSVAPIALTATATSELVTYGQAIPAIVGALGSGVLTLDQGNVTAVFATTATSTSPVATYPITVSLTGSAAANYTVTISGSPTVTIQQATVTAVVANATKVYGSANPTFTGTLTGVLTQDAVNVSGVYSTTATTTSAVGQYSITATGLTGSASGNYKLGAVTPGTLTVTQLAITATATSVTVAYGQAIPAISGSLTGVLTQDAGNVSAVFSTTATSTSPIGGYPISVMLAGTAASNYTVTLTGAPTVTIQKATVSVSANSVSRAYGAANPAFSGVLTGVLPQDAANVAAVFASSATTTSNVGTYPITVTGLTGSAANNYTLGAVTAGVLTVTQAGTTTTVTTSNSGVDLNGNVTLTATVVSATSGTPTGSVTFYAGTEVIGTPTLTNGVASITNPSITQIGGSYSITATYSGSTDFATSTSPAVTETVALPVVGATLSVSSLNVTSGSSGMVTLTLAAQGGYVGTATLSCANLPADMSCSFNPATATFTSTSTTATTVLTISTDGSSSTSALLGKQPGRRSGLTAMPALCLLLPGALLGLLGLSSRRMRAWQRRMMVLMMIVSGLAGTAVLGGCGGSSAPGTPAGTYTINVEITAGTVQLVPLTVTVQ